MDKRAIKDILYEQVARVGKALSSPKRLEILEMLAQGEKAVETVANEVGIDVKLASAHLKTLKQSRLVQARRDGKRMIYRVSGSDVSQLRQPVRRAWVWDQAAVEARLAMARTTPPAGR
jgi:DNA-binding transcriptional ArsR family regulator